MSSGALSFRGICPLPPRITLGHEGAGATQEVGPGVRDLQPGDDGVCTMIAGCGVCAPCQRGEPTRCVRIALATGKMFDGMTRLTLGGTRFPPPDDEAAR